MKFPILISASFLVAFGVGQGKSMRAPSYPESLNPKTSVSAQTALKKLKLGPGIRVEALANYTLTAGGPTVSQMNFGGEGIDFMTDGTNASFSMYDGELDMTFPVPDGASYAVITGGGWYTSGNIWGGFGPTQYPDRFVSDLDRVFEGDEIKTSGPNFSVSTTTKIGSEKTLNFAFGGGSEVHYKPVSIFLHTVQVHYFKIVK